MSFLRNVLNKKNEQKKRKIVFENQKRFPSSLVSHSVKYDKKTILEGENVINGGANISSAFIGVCSIVGGKNDLSNCKIGRFCSIASGVTVQPWTHPTEFVSTYPGFLKLKTIIRLEKGKPSSMSALVVTLVFMLKLEMMYGLVSKLSLRAA